MQTFSALLKRSFSSAPKVQQLDVNIQTIPIASSRAPEYSTVSVTKENAPAELFCAAKKTSRREKKITDGVDFFTNSIHRFVFLLGSKD